MHSLLWVLWCPEGPQEALLCPLGSWTEVRGDASCMFVLIILQLECDPLAAVNELLHLVVCRESYNLRLHCFDSWADEEQEKQRALNREQRQPCRLLDSISPVDSTYISRLCQLQHPTTGGSISTREYLHRMYGYYC